VLAAAAQAVPATAAEPAQAQIIEILHVGELEAGFHLLYELKPAEARAKFEAWQKSHKRQHNLGKQPEIATREEARSGPHTT
jgi:hypothetical protein